MRWVLLGAVLAALNLVLAAPLNAASPKQAQPAVVSDPSQVPLWKDHDRIEDLKDVLFDFDTHESASE